MTKIESKQKSMTIVWMFGNYFLFSWIVPVSQATLLFCWNSAVSYNLDTDLYYYMKIWCKVAFWLGIKNLDTFSQYVRSPDVSWVSVLHILGQKLKQSYGFSSIASLQCLTQDIQQTNPRKIRAPYILWACIKISSPQSTLDQIFILLHSQTWV